jgi:hypothetical protein
MTPKWTILRDALQLLQADDQPSLLEQHTTTSSGFKRDFEASLLQF